MALTSEQILERIDRALLELREIRAAVAGEDARGLTDADRRELHELAVSHAAKLRRAQGGR